MRVAVLVLVSVLCVWQAHGDVNALFAFGGTVQETPQCCSNRPTWFSLWHTFANATGGGRSTHQCPLVARLAFSSAPY